MATYRVGAAKDLPYNDSASWDGGEAEASIWAYAGFDGDSPDPAKARKAFLAYDADHADQKGAYKLPFARVIDGTLTAVGDGLRNAASRLPQTKGLSADVQDRAQAVIDGYLKSDDEKSALPLLHTRADDGREHLTSYEARADAEGGGMAGWPATAWAVDSYGTAFAPGAWRRSIGQRKRADGTFSVPVLYQHNPDWQIGRPTVLQDKRGTDAHPGGLYAETTLFDDGGTVPGTGAVALRHLRQGANFGLSVGFTRVKDRAADDNDPLDFTTAPDFVQALKPADIRVIEQAALWEFSLVSFPANPQAAITNVRAAANLALLRALLEELRAGSLDADALALIDQLVTARQAPGPAEQNSPPPTVAATRDWRSEFVILAAHGGIAWESLAL